MLSTAIIISAILNGLLTGAIYALIALGLTLIYGVLHIINFAHGALLTAAMFAAFFAHKLLGLDPYIAALFLTPIFFVLGYGLQRFVIGPAAHGEDRNILLVTLGIAVIIENALLYAFRADTRTIDVPYGFAVVDLGFTFLSLPRVIASGVVLAVALALWWLLARTDIGKAIRAVAREKVGAELSGIDVAHVYAMTFGLGTACLAIAACLLMPSYYVNPHAGNAFVLVAFTIVVLGGMGSVPGALIGGLVIGVAESLCGLYLGELLGQLGIFVIFILALLFRPTGLFGSTRVSGNFAPIAIVAALLAAVPLVIGSNVALNFLIVALMIALVAQGWNLLGGYGGQYSFGHAAFFGTGAYVTAVLQERYGLNAWPAFGLGIAAGALIGAVIGAVTFRAGLRGSYFALVTLAFAEVLRIVASVAPITGAGVGTLLRLDLRPAALQFHSRAIFYWMILGLVVIALVITRTIERARFGAWLMAVRENEDAARALGVDPTRIKVAAMTISGAITAAGGCFYVQYFLFVDAGIAYGPWISIEALLAPIIGGVGTLFGPLLGALVVKSLGEAAKALIHDAPGLDLVIYGAVLVLVVAFAPDGIAGFLGRLRRRLMTK